MSEQEIGQYDPKFGSDVPSELYTGRIKNYGTLQKVKKESFWKSKIATTLYGFLGVFLGLLIWHLVLDHQVLHAIIDMINKNAAAQQAQQAQPTPPKAPDAQK